MISYNIEDIYNYVIMEDGTIPLPKWNGIGYSINGKLVSAIVWTECSETNLWAHIKVDIPTKEFLVESTRYIFDILGFKRVTMCIPDNNINVIKLVNAMGAKLEYTLKEGHANGDSLIYVLWKNTGIHKRISDKIRNK